MAMLGLQESFDRMAKGAVCGGTIKSSLFYRNIQNAKKETAKNKSVT